jgi:hypothetical protein
VVPIESDCTFDYATRLPTDEHWIQQDKKLLSLLVFFNSQRCSLTGLLLVIVHKTSWKAAYRKAMLFIQREIDFDFGKLVANMDNLGAKHKPSSSHLIDSAAV